MLHEEEFCDDDNYGINPYESFMKKHLQHYGYYTGRNQNYKNQFQHYTEWEKNYGYNLSSNSSEDSESDSDDDKITELLDLTSESDTSQDKKLPVPVKSSPLIEQNGAKIL